MGLRRVLPMRVTRAIHKTNAGRGRARAPIAFEISTGWPCWANAPPFCIFLNHKSRGARNLGKRQACSFTRPPSERHGDAAVRADLVGSVGR